MTPFTHAAPCGKQTYAEEVAASLHLWWLFLADLYSSTKPVSYSSGFLFILFSYCVCVLSLCIPPHHPSSSLILTHPHHSMTPTGSGPGLSGPVTHSHSDGALQPPTQQVTQQVGPPGGADEHTC